MSILKKPVSDAATAEQSSDPAADSSNTGDRRQGDRRQGERRSLDRRGMDNLRAELQWTRAQEADTGGMVRGLINGVKKKPSRIFVLLMAMISGGAAAFLMTQREPQSTPAVAQTITEIIPAKTTQILVARKTIATGQRLSSASLTWEEWPEGSLRSDYITIADAPEAINDKTGAVARFEFFPGEPIREQKLADASQGYLSAILGDGMRGVSVSVTAESASGGFVNPNDHVDVVLTRSSPSRSSSPDEATGTVLQSQTILHNVRVLAINARLGDMGKSETKKSSDQPQAEVFQSMAIATLELDPSKAEVLISATTLGHLSLVLRSAVDFAENERIERRGSNQAIRIASPFWLK